MTPEKIARVEAVKLGLTNKGWSIYQPIDYHLIATHGEVRYDVWPSTGKAMTQGRHVSLSKLLSIPAGRQL